MQFQNAAMSWWIVVSKHPRRNKAMWLLAHDAELLSKHNPHNVKNLSDSQTVAILLQPAV
jgi:hypothetical protein